MTTALDRTVLPPERYDAELAEVRDAAQRGAHLTGPDGTATRMPDEVVDLLRAVLDALAAGRAVTIAPHHAQLTTQEAADLLGVSRPTLVTRLLDGSLSYETTSGGHRRVRLADLVAYQEQTRTDGHAALDDMAAEGEADGLYDDEQPLRRTR